MQNAYYELLKKYARMMTEQAYTAGEAAKLLIETSDGVFATKDGADLADLKAEDVEKLAVEHLPLARKGMSAMVFSHTARNVLLMPDLSGLQLTIWRK